ncbi:MAG TPA: diacylglycerol kinase family protein [Holophaga sp.]|nr:diacylglycerol kinase family protein [Holophaga sp.]
MKLPLVFNHRSGRGERDPGALLARLPRELRERLEPVSLEPPFDYAPHIAQAERAGGPLLVWGGDGTIHHAGRALAASGRPVALAAVPGGSGNGLVRGLRTPLDPAGAVMRLMEGRDLALDLPRLDGEPFLNLCGCGFEGEVAHAFDQAKGRGFANYARTCVGLWRRQPELGIAWEAEAPGEAGPGGRMDRLRAAWRGPEPGLPERAWSLCFANLPQYGSGLWIAPGAHPADGILSWVKLGRPGVLDVVSEVPRLFQEGGRTPLRQEGRILRAIVRLDRPSAWHMDGEPAPARDRAEITLEPGRFLMRVTPECPFLH